MKRVMLAWSSGKDSAWALHCLRQAGGIEVLGLLTTMNEAFDRVAMHAVRRELLERQAAAAGLPLVTVPLPWPCANGEYERRMEDACARMLAAGAEAVAFGDLFLEDVRDYRVKQLARAGLEPLFPLWGMRTAELARAMIAAGQKARVTCVDPRKLDRGFAGRDYDEGFLAALPGGVDPCGENGEFHTFVYESPTFVRPVAIRDGDVVERDGFVFADVLPDD
jgi:uncharacterized protein (TIGR00290 family)